MGNRHYTLTHYAVYDEDMRPLKEYKSMAAITADWGIKRWTIYKYLTSGEMVKTRKIYIRKVETEGEAEDSDERIVDAIPFYPNGISIHELAIATGFDAVFVKCRVGVIADIYMICQDDEGFFSRVNWDAI